MNPSSNFVNRFHISMALGVSFLVLPILHALSVQTMARINAATPISTFWDIFTMTPIFIAASLISAPAATTEPLVSRVPPSHAPATISDIPTHLGMLGWRTIMGMAQMSTQDVAELIFFGAGLV